MGGKIMPNGNDPDCFWQKHGRCLLFAALAVLVGIAVAAVVYNSLSKRNAIDHITAVYDGSTKAGTVLDEDNKGFTVTAYYKDGRKETVSGWTIEEPQTLTDAEKSTVTITYRKASTQCEVQCTTGLIRSITAEYDGDTSAGTEISDETPGIHVFGIQDGGRKTPLDKGWHVVNPTILKKDTLSRVEISYGELTCSLSIQCTTKSISRLTAAYSGSTEEGTVLSAGCEGLAVTAAYADGTSEEVSGWTLAETYTLEPKTRYLLEIHYEDSVCTLEVFCTTPTREEFISGCIPSSYFSLYHSPARSVGINIAAEGVITGRQLREDGTVQIFLEMKGDFLGLTKGTLCAVYSSTLHGNLPEDGASVVIYGMYKGTSEEAYGEETVTMPLMEAEYVIEQ